MSTQFLMPQRRTVLWRTFSETQLKFLVLNSFYCSQLSFSKNAFFFSHTLHTLSSSHCDYLPLPKCAPAFPWDRQTSPIRVVLHFSVSRLLCFMSMLFFPLTKCTTNQPTVSGSLQLVISISLTKFLPHPVPRLVANLPKVPVGLWQLHDVSGKIASLMFPR